MSPKYSIFVAVKSIVSFSSRNLPGAVTGDPDWLAPQQWSELCDLQQVNKPLRASICLLKINTVLESSPGAVMRSKCVPPGKVLSTMPGAEWVQLFPSGQQGHMRLCVSAPFSLLCPRWLFPFPSAPVLTTLDHIWFWFAAVVIFQLTSILTHEPASKWQLPSVPWLRPPERQTLIDLGYLFTSFVDGLWRNHLQTKSQQTVEESHGTKIPRQQELGGERLPLQRALADKPANND